MDDTAPPTASMLTDPSQGRAGGCACGGAEARAERHLRMLQELAEIGMDLARSVQRQAHGQAATDHGAADLGLVFSRIARAVRQTVALEAKLAEDRQKTQAERAPLTVADRWRSARRKRQVKEIVAEAIGSEVGEFDVERLFDDLDERLADGDEEADFAERPIGELVARICRDLGVTPDWSLWHDDDWAIEEAAAKAPGSPYAAHAPEADDPRPDDPGDDPPDRPPLRPPGRTH
ncbi:MAG: hypothetical protein JWP23_2916 [Phenylobacterium sp.]|nr:hypothetical protein [Phenylobacterium sp.]